MPNYIYEDNFPFVNNLILKVRTKNTIFRRRHDNFGGSNKKLSKGCVYLAYLNVAWNMLVIINVSF